MAASEARVSLRSDYGSASRPPAVAWPPRPTPAPKGSAFRASAVIVLLFACTAVAILDVALMLGSFR